jgi:hydrogenase maturation protein HypF
MAAAYLHHVYGEAMEDLELDLVHRLDRRTWRVVRQMLARGIDSPLPSSAGRLFDGIAALIGLRDEVQYEGQAAVELEMLADETPVAGYAFCLQNDQKPMVVETKAIIRGVVDDLLREQSPPRIAAKFHATLAEVILMVCCHIRELKSLRQVALSGGVFQNIRLLTTRPSWEAVRFPFQTPWRCSWATAVAGS